MSLRSEMDDTYRLDRIEFDRLIATSKKKINLITKKKITRSKNTYKRHRDRGHQDSPWPPGLTPGAAIVPRAIPVDWWDSPLETAATDGAEGLSLHEPEVPLRLPVLTVFPASLLFRRESQKATIRVTEESRDLKEAHAGRSSQRPREVAAGWIDNR